MKKKTEKINTIPTAISVKNVSKTFLVPHEKISTLKGAFTNIFKKNSHDVLHALKDVSFEIKKGEFFGIVGRNGSGKSTLLKILAGVYTSDTGSIEAHGAISPFLELGIGFNPELSGRDNIYLNATVLGMTKKEIDEKFNAIVGFSELERFVDQKLKNYSSGMNMRLAFSVAIHANRDILLMDEVLAVGDALFQEKCLFELRRLKRVGKTIILVSHGEQSMRDFADRILVLDQGSVKAIEQVERALFIYNNILVNYKEGESSSNNIVTPDDKKNKIISVSIENEKCIETSIFERDDMICFILRYDIGDLPQRLHVGFAIFDKLSGVQVCGNNTLYENVDLNWKIGLNTITLSFDKNIFHKGDFVFSSSLFSVNNEKEQFFYDMYHSLEHHISFRIIPKDKRNGIICMNHDWKIEN